MRVSENLRRSVGDDGYNALLARALTRTQVEHPALMDVRGGGDADFFLNGIAASVDARGVSVVTAAVESLLATLVDVLSGLIGTDMVLNLLDHDGALPQAPSDRQTQ